MSGSNENYREQALKLYPWVCGRCGRDFSGKQLRELTVHHKDHNHSNNPPDGSNCINGVRLDLFYPASRSM